MVRMIARGNQPHFLALFPPCVDAGSAAAWNGWRKRAKRSWYRVQGRGRPAIAAGGGLDEAGGARRKKAVSGTRDAHWACPAGQWPGGCDEPWQMPWRGAVKYRMPVSSARGATASATWSWSAEKKGSMSSSLLRCLLKQLVCKGYPKACTSGPGTDGEKDRPHWRTSH